MQFYSLEMSLLRSPSFTLYIFLPRFRFLTSLSWAEMPLPWILCVLYHNTLFIITLQIAFPANKTVSCMKTPAMSAPALSCSQRLEPAWCIMALKEAKFLPSPITQLINEYRQNLALILNTYLIKVIWNMCIISSNLPKRFPHFILSIWVDKNTIGLVTRVRNSL